MKEILLLVAGAVITKAVDYLLVWWKSDKPKEEWVAKFKKTKRARNSNKMRFQLIKQCRALHGDEKTEAYFLQAIEELEEFADEEGAKNHYRALCSAKEDQL